MYIHIVFISFPFLRAHAPSPTEGFSRTPRTRRRRRWQSASYLVVEPPPPPADDLSDVLVVVRLFPAHGGEQAEHVLALPEQHVPDQRLLPPQRMGVRRRSRSWTLTRTRTRTKTRTRCRRLFFSRLLHHLRPVQAEKFLRYKFPFTDSEL